MAHRILQEPAPGTALLCHRGDPVTVLLLTPPGGTAWLRTNALSSAVRRAEVIDAVENGAPRPGQDWRDLPMTKQGDGRWACTLTLCDSGSFEAKAYWLSEGSDTPVWAEGGNGNLRMKVQPRWTAACCSVYSAFVRMFRPVPPEEPPGIP
ncbi:MAG TPA: hypothetical protein VHM91_20030, partial [Verrucomicrobiales bacterium]|nr:hypothetical protein [Verrucomicrobiales bacterium]